MISVYLQSTHLDTSFVYLKLYPTHTEQWFLQNSTVNPLQLELDSTEHHTLALTKVKPEPQAQAEAAPLAEQCS
jgi:hypothetical protein